MAVLDLQRKGQQIGRLRMGVMVRPEKGNARPEKLSTWRFTTASKPAADKIAELYGGEIRDWEGQFEVITKESSIAVTIPPRDQVVSQWYEQWNKGGCIRRCDGRTEQLTNGLCQCPHAPAGATDDVVAAKTLERANLAKQNPPQACSLVTRISVMIPDLPGLGVFRLDTKSFYAAIEIGDTAQLLEMARAQGIFLPAMLRIDQRARVAGGKTTRYPVPILEVLVTFRQLATGALEGTEVAKMLPPAPGEPVKAITAGSATAHQPTESEPEAAASADNSDDPEYALACRIQKDAIRTGNSQRFNALRAEAAAGGVLDVFVPDDPFDSQCESFGSLDEFFFREFARKAETRQPLDQQAMEWPA